jgi:hypothetical protein
MDLKDGKTATFDLIQYSYDSDISNYLSYQMWLNTASADYLSLKFTFDPNKKTLTVEKI